MKRVNTASWWVKLRSQIQQFVASCDSCRDANNTTRKWSGILQKILDPTYPWEIINMYFMRGLLPTGIHHCNCILVVVGVFSKCTRLILCQKEATAMKIASPFWKRIISDAGLSRGIIDCRDPNFTS